MTPQGRRPASSSRRPHNGSCPGRDQGTWTWRGEEGAGACSVPWETGSRHASADGYASPRTLSSIALDPLYPSRCSWETFGYATSTSMAQASDGLSPLQLSGQLNSLPCSLTFRQEETISVIRLIEQVGPRGGGRSGAGAQVLLGAGSRDAGPA